MEEKFLVHWADSVVKRIVSQKGEKNKYVVAAGITPSGVIHVGNFREIITVDLVARALNDAGKKVRFIYSWDDYDVFRKIPGNMPKKDMLKGYLRRPIVDIPDPFDEEASYARHHEVEIEKVLPILGIRPEFIYQAKKYRNLDYTEGIKTALKNTSKIKKILNEYRKEPLADDWLPISGYDPETGTDEVEFSEYDGENNIKMRVKGSSEWFDIDITKASFMKLPWRIDWPMRWSYEKVDFEPGGKEHSTVGGSYTTAKEIVKIFGWEAPSYEKYDFITIKGTGGKISSSVGNVITIKDCLEIYEPSMLRWLFAGTRPGTEFAISFDLDVIKLYEDFDRCERIYYGVDEVKEKEYLKQKRIYELSSVSKPPTKIPFQPSFRHLTTILSICSLDIDKVVEQYSDELKKGDHKINEERLRARALCAKNWIEKYAPDEFKFFVNSSLPKDITVSNNIKSALHRVADILDEKEWEPVELHNKFYEILKDEDVDNKEFFKICYNILISRDKGPKLANFITSIGQKKVSKLFKSV